MIEEKGSKVQKRRYRQTFPLSPVFLLSLIKSDPYLKNPYKALTLITIIEQLGPNVRKEGTDIYLHEEFYKMLSISSLTLTKLITMIE